MKTTKLLAGALTAFTLFAQPAAAPLLARQPAAVQHERVLPLQGGQNFRDLGGYRTADGRTVKWGKLYRSGSMHWLTPADQAYLEKRGIRTVCDFRSSEERKAEPVAWPRGHAPTVFADDYSMTDAGLMPSGMTDWTPEKARETMTAMYPQILARFNDQYRRMFRELLAGHAPLAFNCSAGKDRTGVAAALLLTALGVPRATVVEDYALTNRYLDTRRAQPKDSRMLGDWGRMPPETLKAFMMADPGYIRAALAVVDGHADGADGYLRDELGLTRADLVKLRNMYLQ